MKRFADPAVAAVFKAYPAALRKRLLTLRALSRDFRFEGKRALLFGPGDRLPARALRHCIGLALTHHLRK